MNMKPAEYEINIKGLEGDGYIIAIYNKLGQKMLKTTLKDGRSKAQVANLR